MAGSEWRGAQASHVIAQTAVSGLNKAAEQLLKMSQPLAPEETGGLEHSAQTHKTNPVELASQVQYLKFTAVWQHEKLSYHHHVGQAKYLEQPLLEHGSQLAQIVADSIRRGLQ